jgi:hypothetical protein
MPKNKARPPAKNPPTPGRSADAGGGALARARQFAVSRGLPPPQPEDEKPPAAKRKKKPAAKETSR